MFSLNRRARTRVVAAGVLGAFLATTAGANALAVGPVTAVTPGELSSVVRYNASDDDAQVLFHAKDIDGDMAMATISVYGPDGRKIFTERLTRDRGLQVLDYRTAEATPAALEDAYPPGDYRWRGTTVDGRRITGKTPLSYERTEAPTIKAPADGATGVPLSGVTVEWDAVPGATAIFVEVEAHVEAGRELLVRLEGSATSLALPEGYLEAGMEYEVELKALHSNGSQAARDSIFTTG